MSENMALSDDLSRISAAHVLCIGDVMLDRFVYGAVDRISPEAPIPVFLATREKNMAGGAGNVVANIAELGARVTLIAVTGDDADADALRACLPARADARLLRDSARQTTLKIRYVGAGQQMLRVDHEKTAPVSPALEERIIAEARAALPQAGAVILSDYGKGVLTGRVIRAVIDAAAAAKVPVIVDPKGDDFSRYRGASLVTPNRKELEQASRLPALTDAEVRAAAMKIISECGIDAVLATRSKEGMALVQGDADPLYIQAEAREVFDVSGAGDTVIGVMAAAIAAGSTPQAAARLANAAAGVVVGKAGTATARVDEIEAALEKGGSLGRRGAQSAKIVTADAAADQAERWRARGFRVGFTNGTFDLLHPGHLSSIRQAKEACDFLIVAANSDASVRRYKGDGRPVQDQNTRAAILAALSMTDLVVIFDEDTPIELLKKIKPDVLVKGGQYKLEEVVGYDIVMAYGGKIVRAEMEEGFSTTRTIARINAG